MGTLPAGLAAWKAAHPAKAKTNKAKVVKRAAMKKGIKAAKKK